MLGFKALHAMIPDTVGACLENEQYHPVSGDARQTTTNGLLVWRKADNRMAFTDGYRTWVNGPFGLRQRLNTERFSWEHDAAGFPLAGQDQEARLSVYFLRGEKIGAAQRQVPRSKAVGAAALAALLAGPTAQEREAGLHSEIPAGTVLQGLAVHSGVATVDLSGQFESGGGSLSMLARLAQVVFTLTQFPSVERVRLKLDGQPVEAFGGEGVILATYATRRAFADLAPAILVEAPAVGDTVASPLRLRGAALVFEATFLATIVAGDGPHYCRAGGDGDAANGRRRLTLPLRLRHDLRRRNPLLRRAPWARDPDRVRAVGPGRLADQRGRNPPHASEVATRPCRRRVPRVGPGTAKKT